MATSSNVELLEAHTMLWNLTFSYLKSMALDCAITLGLPNAIHKCGGAATLSDLLDNISVPDSKKAHLPCLMRFAMDFIINNYGDMFEGVTSLVDVVGGTGSAARAIAKAFPHIKCSVLDLPNVFHTIQDDGVVEYVAGDMMHSIQPTDAVFLKYVLHDWNDEDCVKILKECK
uniref:Uncharacterized protein n=1 Tax=Avena sativa TaxID=4498 RepID=A0ACD6A7V9_AVESA